DIMRNLTRKNGKFEMSKEDAALALFGFTDKVNQAHASKKHAKDVFEKGSVDAYILSTVTKSMSKGATLDYHTPKITGEPSETSSDLKSDKQREELISKLKELETRYSENAQQIDGLQTKVERNAESLKKIREAFEEYNKNQDLFKRANDKYLGAEKKVKNCESKIEKVETAEEKARLTEKLDSYKLDAQTLGDQRYDCDSKLSIAKGRLDKVLKTHKFVGKTLYEIEQIMNQVKEELDEKIADNRTIERKIAEINAKLESNSEHSV
ncbi:MAG: hypothetical protein IKY10_02685, partial [Clostridia bacterium]|nr:hypothetical protein [Clostridia bacterium]